MKEKTQKAPLQPNQEREEERRNRAIDRFIAGEKAGAISKAVGRSRAWFYQTKARYQQNGREGLKERSRAPGRVHNRTEESVETAVVRVRKTILSGRDPELRYASVGADTIAFELKRAGIKTPSRRTINRILQRQQLVVPRVQHAKAREMPADYPWPSAEQANAIHLFDFVTRSLVGGGRFYGCHLLDQKRRWPVVRLIVNKKVAAVSQFLVTSWQAIGLPTALQIDNDVVWRGSSSAPRTFSHILRLALYVGVEVLFTPPYTPKANAIIESFNALWAENFWLRATFDSLHNVESELVHFETTMRSRHPWPELGGLTAAQIAPDFQPTLLAQDFLIHQQTRIPLTAGRLHFVRFVEADGSFSLLNESWSLDPHHWAGKTIRATLDIQQQQLCIFHQSSRTAIPALIAHFAYAIDETVQPLQSNFKRPRSQLWLPHS